MKRFDLALKELVRRWLRYDDTPRDPVDTRALAKERVALDEARKSVTEAREAIVGRSETKPKRYDGPKYDVDQDKVSALLVKGRSAGSMGG